MNRLLLKSACLLSYFSLTSLLLIGCSESSQPESNVSSESDSYGFTPASSYTQAKNNQLKDQLPFENTEDFDQSKRGFIATIEGLQVPDGQGKLSWNTKAYEFMKGKAPDTVNPSLWRQAQLNNMHGLYKLSDRIYQVRGFDLANMTLIEGDTGWIVIDPLTTVETARVAMDFVNEKLGKRPVEAIIFTHSHIDHFGGSMAIATPEQVIQQDIKVIAPVGFMEEATSENVVAGMAMGRRSMFMYGKRLPKSERGHIGSGLGKEPAFGSFTILEPNILIEEAIETMTIDGIEFQFQTVSGSEAPAEVTFFMPQLKAWCGAEMVSRTMHNLYTLRGAKVRDALLWSHYIDQATKWAEQSDLYFGSHHWPIWGQQKIQSFLKSQRDTYKYIHDQSVRMLNTGLTPNEIAEEMELPPTLAKNFSNRGYYGTVKHNAKAIYQGYLGWYNGNPAYLDPLPEVQSAPKYIALMGGAENVLNSAQKAYEQGDYRWVSELLNRLVFAEPDNQEARELLAKSYDQLGYQSESGPWRDVYLTGAYELRHGGPEKGVDVAMMAGVLREAPLENFFISMAARLKGPEAFDKNYRVNISFIDRDQNYLLWIENAVLHFRKQPPATDVDATLKITHELFLKMAIDQAGIKDTLFSDELTIEGSRWDLINFFRLFDKPKGVFNIVEP
jgi:alkyl sulfatase BDS1-like metallo-beta-lactamase superfamily hydrolase